jgi:ABC-type polysaccharide/polyol phosphate export permease
VAMALAAVLLRTGVPLRPAYWGTLALYALVLHGTGLLLASLFDGFGALALAVNAFLIATATVCPVLYSPDRIPHAIRSAVEILPPSLTVELGNAAAAGVALDRVRLAVLILWALAALLGGYALFPWRDRR